MVPGRPTLAAALALIRQPDPQRKTKKGKPGKGSPRLEKIKKEKWKVEWWWGGYPGEVVVGVVSLRLK